MSPDFFWSPWNLGFDKFWPQEIWVPRNLILMKFGPRRKIIIRHLYAGTKFVEAQTSWGPNFLRTKFLGDQISRGPKKSGAKMRSGTISVTAVLGRWNIWGRLGFVATNFCGKNAFLNTNKMCLFKCAKYNCFFLFFNYFEITGPN